MDSENPFIPGSEISCRQQLTRVLVTVQLFYFLRRKMTRTGSGGKKCSGKVATSSCEVDTWRIIPVRKWLKTMVNKSPQKKNQSLNEITPKKTHMEPENYAFNGNLLFQRFIFRFHVGFRGCKLHLFLSKYLIWSQTLKALRSRKNMSHFPWRLLHGCSKIAGGMSCWYLVNGLWPL